MMEQHTFIHIAIHWIRASILILSILIIITSLNQYSKKSTSIFTLLHENTTHSDNDDEVNLAHRFGQAIIQDRRLIATLVAAQASIFCPLFLLMSNNNQLNTSSSLDAEEEEREHSDNNYTLAGFWDTALDLLCQFLLPLGLSLSWLFCISFDHKTNSIINNYSSDKIHSSPSPSSYIWSLVWDNCSSSVNTVHGLKYLIVLALVFEMIFITIAWIQYSMHSLNFCKSRKQNHLYLLPTQIDQKQ